MGDPIVWQPVFSRRATGRTGNAARQSVVIRFAAGLQPLGNLLLVGIATLSRTTPHSVLWQHRAVVSAMAEGIIRIDRGEIALALAQSLAVVGATCIARCDGVGSEGPTTRGPLVGGQI